MSLETTRKKQAPPAPYIIEPTGGVHTYTAILLHGLGSNGEAFGRELCQTGVSSDGKTLPQLLPKARFIFPSAPRRRSSAFGRSMLTQWFDIARLPDPEYRRELQLPGLQETAITLIELLQEEQKTVAPANMILGGNRQGCAASISLLLSQHRAGEMHAALAAAEEAVSRPLDEDDFLGYSDDTLKNKTFDPMVSAAAFQRIASQAAVLSPLVIFIKHLKR